jgi:ferredoxin-type protein NapF
MKRSIDRLQFLRGDFSGDRRGIRPPWARSEAAFTDRCERCGDCIAACPEAILVQGSGGFPVVEFTLGACTFCGKCAASCTHDAYETPDHRDAPAWRLDVVIGEHCLSRKGVVCRSCGEACESVAIRFRLMTGGRAQPTLDPIRCNGCGTCFAVCPVRCISISPGADDCAA